MKTLFLCTSDGCLSDLFLKDIGDNARVISRDVNASVPEIAEFVIAGEDCSDEKISSFLRMFSSSGVFHISRDSSSPHGYKLKKHDGSVFADCMDLLSHFCPPDYIDLNIYPGRTETAMKINEMILRQAKSNEPLLICGESGTGKNLAAEMIHNLSRYKEKNERPFIFNCNTLSSNLIESQLFGAVPGSYTGAERLEGYLDAAKNNTIIFDEIGDLSLEEQGVLLDLTDRGFYRAVGSTKEKKINSRLIFITNKNLYEMMLNNEFRKDLFYRICYNIFLIPPLSEHKMDIPVICDYYLSRTNKSLSLTAWNRILEHEWTGNIRELKGVLMHAAEVASANTISADDIVFAENIFKSSKSFLKDRPFL